MSSETAVLTPRRTAAVKGGPVRLFTTAAARYWLGVFPAARASQRRLLAAAEAIPDPLLRADALASHHEKGSNSEGLAALAVLAPAGRRAAVARSLVAYQLMLDYLDGVSERPSDDPLANGLRLHEAFDVALDPGAAQADYYELAPGHDDGGYLRLLIETCRAPLSELPSYPVVRDSLLRQARLCRESQALNHALRFGPVGAELDRWAARTAAETGLGPGFEWWELIAAAAASSLCVGALLSLAANPGVGEAEARRLEEAYFPWASGLNALLDSLVDLDEDPEDESHLRRYESREHAAERLREIAAGARSRVAALPDGRLHEAILAAMGSLYLIHEEAWRPDREPVSLAVFGALGPLARPSLTVHLMRRRGRGARAVIAAGRRSRARP
jgi:tetraprenyl-beta-curcumene synthase